MIGGLLEREDVELELEDAVETGMRKAASAATATDGALLDAGEAAFDDEDDGEEDVKSLVEFENWLFISDDEDDRNDPVWSTKSVQLVFMILMLACFYADSEFFFLLPISALLVALRIHYVNADVVELYSIRKCIK